MTAPSDDLDDVYGAKSPAEARAIYDQWSASYDAENLAKDRKSVV